MDDKLIKTRNRGMCFQVGGWVSCSLFFLAITSCLLGNFLVAAILYSSFGISISIILMAAAAMPND
jgi:hypothetical protein